MVHGRLLALHERIFGRDVMQRNKPIRQTGENVLEFPTYSFAEASAFLAIPERTLYFWFDGPRAIFRPAAKLQSSTLLSFRNLADAYALQVLRTFHQVPTSSVRRALASAKRQGIEHPLWHENIKVFLRSLVLDKPARGRRRRQVIDLSDADQPIFPEVADQVARRILIDPKKEKYRIFPWRLLKEDRESRPVCLDPHVLSGRLVVSGTRVPVRVLLGRRASGESPEALADDYGLPVLSVEKALAHIDTTVHQKAA